MNATSLLLLLCTIHISHSFSPPLNSQKLTNLKSTEESWTGEITNTPNGAIRGCSLERAPNSLTTWTITIDGVEADTGKFSEAIYKKITMDARQQQFQGFRPGTIPPHILPTYKAFTMDECARETIIEAMEQNNVKPFEDAREEMILEKFSIPPPKKKKKGKKKKKVDVPVEEEQEVWLTFDSMKEAIKAGWAPGQTFSFVAKNVKGQQLQDGTSPIGQGRSIAGGAIDLNRIAGNVASDAANYKQ